MRHVISVLVENKFGVLARIAGLFSARGFNIESLAVGETHDPAISRMTIVVDARDERILEQIKKQLHKLIDIITVWDLTEKDYVDRELVLVKIKCSPEQEKSLNAVLGKHRAKLVDLQNTLAVIEAVGDEKAIRLLLDELKKFEVVELVRTGRIAIVKG
ncbi:MAG: acetolactate synthase small subunit [Candidatus Omnitrophota bacterium]